MTHDEFFFELSEEERHERSKNALINSCMLLNNDLFKSIADVAELKAIETMQIICGAYMNGELIEGNIPMINKED